MKKAFLSWSGNLSHKVVVYIKEKIFDHIFNNEFDTFISSEMGIGSIADKTIFAQLTASDFVLSVLHPRTLRSHGFYLNVAAS